MKRNFLAAVLVVVLGFQFGNAAEKISEIKDISIYEFSDSDMKWILANPSVKILKEEGNVLFSSDDLKSLKSILLEDTPIIRFHIQFSDAGKSKFEELMLSRSYPRLFLVINGSTVISELFACGGCDAIDGSLPRYTYDSIVTYFKNSEN